ncbi:uncharacterized protein LOC135502370 [Lineus longissimus]|uniref:uncharacterized protein LOC135502370 n=1 Tax=Lineus longissimus TaxID=88925 RepID=UPI002B4DB0B5
MKCHVFALTTILVTSLVHSACSKDDNLKTFTNEQCNKACRDYMYECIGSLTPGKSAEDCISDAGSCYGDCLVDSPPSPIRNCYTGCQIANRECLRGDCQEKACTMACKFQKKACKAKCVRMYRLKQELVGGVIKPKND